MANAGVVLELRVLTKPLENLTSAWMRNLDNVGIKVHGYVREKTLTISMYISLLIYLVALSVLLRSLRHRRLRNLRHRRSRPRRSRLQKQRQFPQVQQESNVEISSTSWQNWDVIKILVMSDHLEYYQNYCWLLKIPQVACMQDISFINKNTKTLSTSKYAGTLKIVSCL